MISFNVELLADVEMTADALFGDADDISSDSDVETVAKPSQESDGDGEDNVRRGEDEEKVTLA